MRREKPWEKNEKDGKLTSENSLRELKLMTEKNSTKLLRGNRLSRSNILK